MLQKPQICRRIADVATVPRDRLHHGAGGMAEAMQLVYYEPGQGYAPRHDWGVGFVSPASRFLTFLLYLNGQASPDAGGETSFPKCPAQPNLSLRPGEGGAGFFYNLLPDGHPDEFCLHSAEPVTVGE